MATNSFSGNNSFAGGNTFAGTNSALDPNAGNNRTMNLGNLKDQGLANILARDTGASELNQYSKGKFAKLGDINEAAQNYATLDTSNWLDQYRNMVSPHVAGYSSTNKNLGYVNRDLTDDIERLLTADTAPGYSRKMLDDLRYDLQDSGGVSRGIGYYGVDDVLRNQYRRTLGDVGELKYTPVPAQYAGGDEMGNGAYRVNQTPDELLWEKFLKGRTDANKYGLGVSEDGQPSMVLNPETGRMEPFVQQSAYKWGDSLYESKDLANAAREAQIAARPNAYRNLMEKYEAAGEGGIDPQNWKGNYGGDNVFSGAGALHQLNAQQFMKVDPTSGVWSSAGYRIDPNSLSPEAFKDWGSEVNVEKGKASKPWKKAGPAVATFEQGGNAVWRDYGDQADELAALMRRDESGNLIMGEGSINYIPTFANRNKHIYDVERKELEAPKNSKKGLFNNVFNFLDPIIDVLDPLHNPTQNVITNVGGFDSQQQAFSTIAPLVISALMLGQDYGALSAPAAAEGAAGAGAAATAAGTGAAAGNALGTGLTWGQIGQGVLAANAASEGNWGGALMGGLGAAGFNDFGLGSKIANSAARGIIGGGLDALGKKGNVGQGALSGLVGGLAGGAIGSGASSAGLGKGITGALSNFGAGAARNLISKKKPSDRQWSQLAINSALGGLR